MSFDYGNIDVSEPQAQWHLDYPKEWKVMLQIHVPILLEPLFNRIKKLYSDVEVTSDHKHLGKFYRIRYSPYLPFRNLMESLREIRKTGDVVSEINIECLNEHQVPTDIVLNECKGIGDRSCLLKIKNLKICDFNLLDTDLYNEYLPSLQLVNCHIQKVICNTTWGANLRIAINFVKTKIDEGEYHYKCGHVLNPGKVLRSDSKYFTCEYIEKLEKDYNPAKKLS